MLCVFAAYVFTFRIVLPVSYRDKALWASFNFLILSLELKLQARS